MKLEYHVKQLVCLRIELKQGLSQPHLWICFCVNRYSIHTKQLANMEEDNSTAIKEIPLRIYEHLIKVFTVKHCWVFSSF